MGRWIFLMTQIPMSEHIGPNSFGFLIQVLARQIDAKMKVELKKAGVDHKIFANLMLLGQNDGINQRAIGKKLNFPEYFTSRNIDAMVDAGYAERRPDPDSRRSFLVFLTKEGKKKAAELPPIIKRVNDEVLKDLDQADRTNVIKLLQIIAGHPAIS